MATVIGFKTSRDIWQALSHAYCHHSKARKISLKDNLLSAKRGSLTVAEYGRHYKSLCDHLAAIRRPIDEFNKSHWFLGGLRSTFSIFTTAQLAQDPLPDFTTLMARAQSHELFQKSIDDSSPSQVAVFTAVNRGRGCGGPNNHGRRGRETNYRGRGRNNGGGRGRRNFTPSCQFCRGTDHDVFDCPKRFDQSYDRSYRSSFSSNLAEAFSAIFSISQPNASDWYLDTGASAHMNSDATQLDTVSSYSGNDCVTVGNEPGYRAASRNRDS